MTGPLTQLIVNGFSTGLGYTTAQFIFELYIKPRIKRVHKKISKGKEIIKKIMR
jgi:hypothetical protein